MDVEAAIAARYQAMLAHGVHTSPTVRVDLGDGQEVEVVHTIADPIQTVVFFRVHGGPPPDAPHFGPPVEPIDPPEIVLGHRSGTRWGDLEIAQLPPVLPVRRTITLAFGRALPADAPPEVIHAEQQRVRENPTGVLTIPIDPDRAARHVRTGLGGVVARSADLSIEALSFVASATGVRVSVRVEPPECQISGTWSSHPFAPREIPLVAPPALWRDLDRPARGNVAVFRDLHATEVRRRALLRDSWRATSLPGGERLDPQGSACQQQGVHLLTFDAPPATATGIRLVLDQVYRWEPIATLTTLRSPDPEREVDLRGASLAWPDGRLDFVSWEPAGGAYTLVARPTPPFDPATCPAWLPELRLVVGDASAPLPCLPCDDSTFACTVLADLVGDQPPRVAIRGVGRRLPPLALDLRFD